MPRVYLGLGSNLEPERNLAVGLRELRRRFGRLDLSPVYRNPAVGFEGQDFLNLVVAFDTNESPAAISEAIEEIHTLAGRERNEERFASRTLDIDILLYGDECRKEPRLTLPRPDILEYAFVLKPLSDLAPDAVHPQTGRTYRELWERMRDRGGHELTRVELPLG